MTLTQPGQSGQSASQTASAARGSVFWSTKQQPTTQGYSRGRQPVTVVEPEGAGAGEAHPQKIIRGGRVVFNRVTTYSSSLLLCAFHFISRGPALPQRAAALALSQHPSHWKTASESPNLLMLPGHARRGTFATAKSKKAAPKLAVSGASGAQRERLHEHTASYKVWQQVQKERSSIGEQTEGRWQRRSDEGKQLDVYLSSSIYLFKELK